MDSVHGAVNQRHARVHGGPRAARRCLVDARCAKARGCRCSSALAGDDEEDEAERPAHRGTSSGGDAARRRWKLHDMQALEQGMGLESRVERCGEGREWCSPFIGVGGAPGRQLPESNNRSLMVEAIDARGRVRRGNQAGE
jgi:hypothetical protein